MASIHAEVSAGAEIAESHAIVDRIEREAARKMGLLLVIHMDPVETDNERLNTYRKMLENVLADVDVRLSFHDFRMVSGPTHTNLIFDIVVPFECKLSFDDIRKQINDHLNQQKKKWYTVITFDRDYTAE